MGANIPADRVAALRTLTAALTRRPGLAARSSPMDQEGGDGAAPAVGRLPGRSTLE